ncbi:hypothetical protein AB205_0146860 [Aquarana catesbeiana]|uniref:Uncharacterized protein n=1 Tax=Aquarana catesbeiana TaxID=8400 RepID=A0A2G9RHZ2_AQUCT|nr:hypothetical protein AB205_0146860 [Aquarana catesbeiana]
MLRVSAHRRVHAMRVLGVGVITLTQVQSMNRVGRSSWTKNRLLQHDQFSHMPLLHETQENNPDDFRDFLWMTDPAFHCLLALLSPYITKQDTCMWQTITPEQRLVATLRYLATGRSLQDLKFSTGISPQALGIIIPETCSAIIQVLQKDYIREDLSQDEALECGTQEEAGVSVSQEVVGPSRSLTQSQVPPLRLPTKRARKGSNVKEAAPGLIKEANVALKSPPNTKEAYGCYVAARLQQMEEGQCLRCEKIIFEAIHKELSGQISDNMHLVALAHPPPPPLATSPPPEPQPSRKAAGNRAGKAARKTRK